MVGKILIDTNVLLDYLLEREPFFEDAKKVIYAKNRGVFTAPSLSYTFIICA